MVEAFALRVLQQFDARAPRVEHKPVPEHAWKLAQSRSIVKALQSHARASHADRFQFGHLGPDIRVGERDVVDASPLRTAHGRLHGEDQLDAVARGGIGPTGYWLAVQVPAVPAHRLRRTGCGDLHVMEVRGEHRRCQDGRSIGGCSGWTEACHGDESSSVVSGSVSCGGGRTLDPRRIRRT